MQIVYLFLGSLSILFVGMGLFPILPVYAARFGVSTSLVGVLYATMSAAYTLGPLVVDWLARRIGRKALFIFSGLAGVPALALLAIAGEFWQLAVLTSITWFFGGINLALISILTGLLGNGEKRGRSFGLLGIAVPLGALVGGAAISPLLNVGSYPLLFLTMAGVWALLPLFGLFGLDFGSREEKIVSNNSANMPAINLPMAVLIVVCLFGATGISVIRLGSSLVMNSLAFDVNAVASTATLSGLVAIPITWLSGTLSDRLGRPLTLIAAYALAAGGSLILSSATQLSQFQTATAMMMSALCVSGALSPALAADLLPKTQMNRGIAWVTAANATASVGSFALTGVMLSRLGAGTLFGLVTVAPLAAMTLLWLLGRLPGDLHAHLIASRVEVHAHKRQ